jgi:hypothetical protein
MAGAGAGYGVVAMLLWFSCFLAPLAAGQPLTDMHHHNGCAGAECAETTNCICLLASSTAHHHACTRL